MNQFTKILFAAGTGAVLLFTYLASSRGWGLEPLTNSNVMMLSKNDCPEHLRDANGNCPPHTYRNRLYRSRIGGSHGFGK